MRTVRIAALTTLVSVGATAAGLEAQQPVTIARAAWLAGCWEQRSARGTIEEQWMAPRGRTMIGSGRTIRGDSLFEFEQIVLRERGGQLLYEAHPSGQAGTTFTSTAADDTSLVFENPQHDFPQKVGYLRRGVDSLVAFIEGPRNGQTRRITFTYARVTCGQ